MSIYASTARFDSARALSEDELYKLAPSIFATAAHESRSARFAPIPTIEVLRGLMAEGFMPVGARQSGSRELSKRDFTKHLIRLRRIDDDSKFKVGDTVCEILLKNANDGTSAYDLMAGLFRIRCLNSLVAQVGTLESLKVRHSGDARAKVIEGTYSVLNEAHKALDAPANWQAIEMKREERELFAEAALQLRYNPDEGETIPFAPSQILRPRREGDTGADLWTTLNVAQEHLIRGGARAIARDANNRPRRVKMRPINNIDGDVKLNKALWTLAEGMAKLKAAA